MTHKYLILLVEDEESLAIGLEFNLSQENYDVVWARDGKKALELIEKRKFDLIILDIMLPYYDGFEIASRVRHNDPQMPILMLTARTSADDRVKGLETGADDYMTKPFHLKELWLRVKGMLKRKAWYQNSLAEQPRFRFGKNEVNFSDFTAKRGSRLYNLTQHEAMVLKYLIEKAGTVVSRRELLQNVWHVNPEIETRTVDNFIARLRRYFEPNPSRPKYIQSVRGAGYIFRSES